MVSLIHRIPLALIFSIMLISPTGAAYYSDRDVIGSVYFASGSLNLSESSKREISRIAEKIREFETTGDRLIIRVEGYSDSVGEKKRNLILSMNRSAAVEEYLVRVEGISAELYITGFGESKVVSLERTIKKRLKNRRVDVVRIIEERDYLKVFRMEKK